MFRSRVGLNPSPGSWVISLRTGQQRRTRKAVPGLSRGKMPAAPQNELRTSKHLCYPSAMADTLTTTALTLKDIARQAGVSLATVDRVLHNRPGVRPDTVRRVKEAIERNSFQPHVAAAELARGRARRFAFVMPSGPNPFMQQIQAYLGEMSACLAARRLAVEL